MAGRSGYKPYDTNDEFPRDWWNYYVNPISGFPPEEYLEPSAARTRDKRLKNEP